MAKSMSAKRKTVDDGDASTSEANGQQKSHNKKPRKMDSGENSDVEEQHPDVNRRASSSKAKQTPALSNGRAREITYASNGQPNNGQLPLSIEFPPRLGVRIASWNICGLSAASKKGFSSYVVAEDADILVLCETKVANEPVDPALTARYPHQYWSICAKKGHAGTAILSKIKPLSVSKTVSNLPDASLAKGRIITLEFPTCWIVGTYVPNAGQKLVRLNEKATWNEHFANHLRGLDASKPVIWTGDLNVAPAEIDLSNPKKNWNKTAGYTAVETEAFANILNPPAPHSNMVDVWREKHPDDRHYTYWSYRFQCRHKGIGWRIDTFVVSERIVNRVKLCQIRDEIYGASDHVPIVLEMEGEL